MEMWKKAALRSCSCLGVYKIEGAGRNAFAAIIICSLASNERGIIFFTVIRVSELLGFLEHVEHLGHIVQDCNSCRKWIFPAVIFSGLHALG